MAARAEALGSAGQGSRGLLVAATRCRGAGNAGLSRRDQIWVSTAAGLCTGAVRAWLSGACGRGLEHGDVAGETGEAVRDERVDDGPGERAMSATEQRDGD